ncbi:serine/threonine kinase 31 isoform X1 [Ictalurus punctatus]|uniref:Serine/threonine kinase 31 isoform X1 n=2 Tax=Ictalurus punctatus TaxID=7998 RepID=A0A2D0SQC3_ICTPU|nr:serine/threonine kinase 31 isoform X1 [Ictalurus punctatus]
MSSTALLHCMLSSPSEARDLLEQSRDPEFEKMELVVVTHVLDAITFWAQNVTEDKVFEKLDMALSETCPTAQSVKGQPSPHKVYGACYSGDRCWYRCKVQKQIDDTFHVAYIDYGNEEVVGRLDLVELPEDLQSAALAKRYKFWGFHLASEQDSPHYSQGKSFLQNLIYGKKLRINIKAECFDGTILVKAFQGNLDIGEEVLKFKFATVNFPGNRESPSPTKALQKQTGVWPSRRSQGDHDSTGTLGYMPKLRPVFSNQTPQALKEPSTSKSVMAANVLEAERELVKENTEIIQQLCGQVNEQMLTEAKSELQCSREEVKEKIKEIKKIEKEKNDLQNHADHLQQQLKEARLELQKVSEVCPRKDESVEVNMVSTVCERFSRLAEKVEAVRSNRERNECPTAEQCLSESIPVVVNNRIVMPLPSETLEMAWEDYRQSLKQLKECQSKAELEDLVNSRNQARSVLLAAIDDFLLVVGSLPISDRLNTLKDVSSSLMAAFGSVSEDDVQDQSLEQFCEWKSQKHRNFRNVRHATDKALCALSDWAANTSKFFCMTEKSAVTLEAVGAGVDELLEQAESDVCEELSTKFFEQNVEDMKIMSTACGIVMQRIKKEEYLLCGLRKMYEDNKKFKEDMVHWQKRSPKADELLQIKKHIKSLRSQLRWKLVEVGCMEEADELDLPEILRKKEEIAETRNALFQEIMHEKEQYVKLCGLVKGDFPELLQLYPEADIDSYLLSEGLLMKSLDRDLFDAEPMKELSGRRPLVCTEFQCQKVVLKSYSVDEESEVRMIKQAAQYHKVQNQHPSTAMPLLGLFFSKSDPLAYIMVPYYSNGSLKALQKLSPLTPSEIGRVMRGVLLGLQSLHESCITHASLNANNLFAVNREQGIVGDFDFTKTPEQRAVDCGMVAGSISLVAPELRQSQLPSPATDMYAVGGVMLWLHVPDCTGDNEQQVPRLSGLQLDVKVQTLLSKLLVCSRRLSAVEALCDDYFLSLEN